MNLFVIVLLIVPCSTALLLSNQWVDRIGAVLLSKDDTIAKDKEQSNLWMLQRRECTEAFD